MAKNNDNDKKKSWYFKAGWHSLYGKSNWSPKGIWSPLVMFIWHEIYIWCDYILNNIQQTFNRSNKLIPAKFDGQYVDFSRNNRQYDLPAVLAYSKMEKQTKLTRLKHVIIIRNIITVPDVFTWKIISRFSKSKKTLKLRVTGLCAGNSPVTGELSAQRAINADNVSIWWRHHCITGA